MTNTKEIRTQILDRIEADGVNLSEFTKDVKIMIIKAYALAIIANK